MIKRTEEGQKWRSKKLNDLRQRVSKLKRLDSYKESSEWKDLKSIILDFIEMHKNEEKLACQACEVGGYWQSATQEIKIVPPHELVSDIRVARKINEAYELIIKLVEDNENQIEHIESTITNLEHEYKEAKEELGV